MTVPDAERRNHTIDYFRALLKRVPEGPVNGLDVGCGEGFGSRALAGRGVQVTAVDIDPASLELARAQDCAGITYLEADFMTASFPATFDLVVALAVLHHVPLEAGLERLKTLLSPGGMLLVVGLAASALPKDAAWEVAAVIAHQTGRLTHREWEQPSPTVWPPPVTYGQVREASARILPGSEYKRRVKWRYTLTWVKP